MQASKIDFKKMTKYKYLDNDFWNKYNFKKYEIKPKINEKKYLENTLKLTKDANKAIKYLEKQMQNFKIMKEAIKYNNDDLSKVKLYLTNKQKQRYELEINENIQEKLKFSAGYEDIFEEKQKRYKYYKSGYRYKSNDFDNIEIDKHGLYNNYTKLMNRNSNDKRKITINPELQKAFYSNMNHYPKSPNKETIIYTNRTVTEGLNNNKLATHLKDGISGQIDNYTQTDTNQQIISSNRNSEISNKKTKGLMNIQEFYKKIRSKGLKSTNSRYSQNSKKNKTIATSQEVTYLPSVGGPSATNIYLRDNPISPIKYKRDNSSNGREGQSELKYNSFNNDSRGIYSVNNGHYNTVNIGQDDIEECYYSGSNNNININQGIKEYGSRSKEKKYYLKKEKDNENKKYSIEEYYNYTKDKERLKNMFKKTINYSKIRHFDFGVGIENPKDKRVIKLSSIFV